MKTGAIRLIVCAIVVCMASQAVGVDLYFNNLNSDLPGPGIRPSGFFEFHGPNSLVWSEATVETGSVDNSQYYKQTVDSTASAADFFFFAGFGQFAVNFTNMPTDPGSNNASRYKFSADVKVDGNNGGSGTTPVEMRVAAIDPDYETEHNIDVNNDSVISGGAAVYTPVVAPTIAATGQWTHVSFTLDQGTQDVDPDVRPQDRVFSNQLSLLWQFNYHAGGFGFDAGNVISVDNLRIEFSPQTALDGDFNSDGKVDAADYVTWRENIGTSAAYSLWRENFGNPPSTGLALANVPEPRSIALVGALSLLFLQSARRKRSAVH